MNRKRKILTLAALVVFGVIIALHTLPTYEHSYRQFTVGYENESIPGALITGAFRREPQLDDKQVKLALFVLAVFYGGLFFVLGTNRTENRAPNP